MKFFKKKGLGVVDFTKLPDSRVKHRNDLKVSGDCVDLRDKDNVQSRQSPTVTSAANSVMDFLGGGNVSNSNTNSFSSGTSSFSDSANPNEIVELKRILRTTSGKIEDNSNELYRMLQKLELLEKKIERLESRGGL